jgi:hypothetical protein
MRLKLPDITLPELLLDASIVSAVLLDASIVSAVLALTLGAALVVMTYTGSL